MSDSKKTPKKAASKGAGAKAPARARVAKPRAKSDADGPSKRRRPEGERPHPSSRASGSNTSTSSRASGSNTSTSSPRARGASTRGAGAGEKTGRPRLRASHAEVATRTRRKEAPRSRPSLGGATPGRAMPPAPQRARSEPRPLAKARPAEPTSRARVLSLAVAEAGLDKKALGVEIIDVTGRVDYADFLVLMTGRSDRQVQAIAGGIADALSKLGSAPISVEGMQAGTWVLLDFGDVVAHVFQEEARRVYDIEGLWMDEQRVPVPNPAPEGRGEY